MEVAGLNRGRRLNGGRELNRRNTVSEIFPKE